MKRKNQIGTEKIFFIYKYGKISKVKHCVLSSSLSAHFGLRYSNLYFFSKLRQTISTGCEKYENEEILQSSIEGICSILGLTDESLITGIVQMLRIRANTILSDEGDQARVFIF